MANNIGNTQVGPRTVSVLHLAHRREDKGLALFPIGIRYNKELTELRKGDYIQFQSGEKREVVSVALMSVHSAIAEQMSRYIYGHTMSRIWSQWALNAVAEGHPRDAINKDQCIQIHYKL